jgi:hypothetical protein
VVVVGVCTAVGGGAAVVVGGAVETIGAVEVGAVRVVVVACAGGSLVERGADGGMSSIGTTAPVGLTAVGVTGTAEAGAIGSGAPRSASTPAVAPSSTLLVTVSAATTTRPDRITTAPRGVPPPAGEVFPDVRRVNRGPGVGRRVSAPSARGYFWSERSGARTR